MSFIEAEGHIIEVISKNTVIVGAGAAALNAADRLYSYGNRDIAVVCEDLMLSTSMNTGSDKQTYYKLTLAGAELDSVYELAKTLMSGGCVDGDIALAEAANSAACFLRLCELGVPFPTGRYGEYTGYKTDHDPRRRATSAGPLTSRIMTERLTDSVRKKNIPVYEGMQVISILTGDDTALGLLCLNIREADSKEKRFTAFNCENIIYATGGPAGMYLDSVYPHGQYGASGIAFEAGVKGRNLTEWQYGLASLKPRWNVSGTYMQCLPRFISTDSGGGEREFLYDRFPDKAKMLSAVFLKGYEWPFDVRRAKNGSSLIDILVYTERMKGRRVYLDYRDNTLHEDIDFSALSSEAALYLQKAGAHFGKPIDRLVHMNAPAYEFYLKNGVDLKKQPLEIALCVQHNNGGLAVDCWWQTNIKGLFAAGEACATHGVYRPGGSALNAGQVGSMRAAQYIAAKRIGSVRDVPSFSAAARDKIEKAVGLYKKALSQESNVDQLMLEAQTNMSKVAAAIRDYSQITKMADETKRLLRDFVKIVKIKDSTSVSKLYRLYDILLSQHIYLSAMKDYIENGGKSRGSALYLDGSGREPRESLDEALRFVPGGGEKDGVIQEATLSGEGCVFKWRETRPIPEDDDFFENIWKQYRENGNVY